MSARDLRHGYLAAAASVLLWSSFMLVSRLAGKSALTAFDLLALRLGTATVLLLCLAPLPARRHWRDYRLWLLAVTGCVLFCLLCYSAVHWVPAAHLGLLIPGIQPFLVALLLLLGGHGLPARATWPGYALMALGMLLLGWPLFSGTALPGQAFGDAMLLLASLLWAVYALLCKRWQYEPWLLTRFVTLASALLYLPLYGWFLPHGLALTPWPVIIGQALFHGVFPAIVAMLCYLRAVAQLGPSRVAALMALIPVLTGVAAVPLLDEALGMTLALALLSVSLGVWWVARAMAPAGNQQGGGTGLPPQIKEQQACRM